MSVKQRPSGVWRAKILGPEGKQIARHFRTKIEAQRWEREQLAARDRGQFVEESKLTVADYCRQWAATRPHKALTALRTLNMIERHIADQPIGSRRLSAVRPSEVQAWVTGRAQVLAPSTVRLLYGHLSAVYTSAVLDRLVTVSPVQRIKLPDATQERIVALTVEQVEALASVAGERYRAMIITQAGLGLRLGELIGLRVDDVNFLGRSVRVEYQRDRLTQKLVAPKTPRSRRTIPLPQVVADALAAHLAKYEPARDGGIFTKSNGQPINHNSFHRDIFKPAVEAAGLPTGTTSHDLRHAYASWLLAAGESVVTVAERLGHTDATLVVRTYGHMVPGQEERTRQAIDRVWAANGDRKGTGKITQSPDQ